MKNHTEETTLMRDHTDETTPMKDDPSPQSTCSETFPFIFPHKGTLTKDQP